MTHITQVLKRRPLSSSLCFILVFLMVLPAGVGSLSASSMPRPAVAAKGKKSSRSAGGSFEKPDFAFPKKVEADALPVFRKALRDGDGINAVRAAIQLDVAASEVSADSYRESLARFDTIASNMGAPWNSLARLLEARLYKEIYDSNEWTFDHRLLPMNVFPENVMEWSGAMFDSRIRRLLEEVYAARESLSAVPLREVAGLLVSEKDACEAGFTVFDFAVVQALSLIDGIRSAGDERPVIPFGSATAGADQRINENIADTLLSQAIEEAEASGITLKGSWLRLNVLYRLPHDRRRAYLEKCMDLYTDSPYCSWFIVNYCSLLPDDNDGRRNRMRLLDDYISRYPDAIDIETVRNAASELRQKNINVCSDETILSDAPSRVIVSGANIYDFYLLAVAVGDKKRDHSCTYSDLRNGRVVASVPVRIRGTVPDAYCDTLSLPGLAPGRYAIVPSSTESLSGVLKNKDSQSVDVVNVTTLSYVIARGAQDSGLLYVVKGANQQPVQGATVRLYEYVKGNRVLKTEMTTNSEGAVKLPAGNNEFEIIGSGSRVEGSAYIGRRYDGENSETLCGKVLTDLSIYRPGDSVGFVSVLYKRTGNRFEAVPERKFRAVLRDANWQNVDTLELVTDRFGRAHGSFRLPEKGLLGRWRISLAEENRFIETASFEVGEYKTPGFLVSLHGEGRDFQPGDTITFKGEAMTYAGMPVAGATVRYEVVETPLWWRIADSSGAYGGEALTAPDGSFTISLPTGGLKGTRFENGYFRLSATVTDEAGESQEAAPVTFGMGKGLHIAADMPDMVEAGEIREFQVTVRNLAGEPVQEKVYYKISGSDGTVESGEFESPVFRFNTADVKSGRYAFSFSLSPEFPDVEDGTTETCPVTFWRKSDVRPPVQSVLWVPEKNIIAPRGAGKVTVRVGTSLVDRFVLAMVSDSRSVKSCRWLEVSDGFVSLDVDAPEEDGRMFVSLAAMDSLRTYEQSVTIIPFSQTVDLKAETVSFRDRVTPGARESWRFRFTMEGKPVPDIAVMAVMTDKALNALADFRWGFNPDSERYWNRPGSLSLSRSYLICNYYYAPISYLSSSKNLVMPEWNTYGLPLYSGFLRGVRIRGTGALLKSATKARGVAMPESCEDDAVMNETVAVESYAANSVATSADMAMKAAPVESEEAQDEMESESEIVSLRPVDMPLAFFMPSLVTNDAGEASVEFSAPDFVGTWQFQILGYDSSMHGAALRLDALSAKAVMAHMNAPRFVRTGDDFSLQATLFNNTAAPAPVGGRIEILDAVTDSVLSVSKFEPEELQASGSRTVSIQFRVPSDTEALVLRVVGYSGGSSDGEQTLVPVLPATSVVRESTPFWLAPDATEWSFTLPRYAEGASLSLSYCGNPVWECVTALPALIVPESDDLLTQCNALFGNSVAAGLFKKYPRIAEGIRLMASDECRGDSSLYSPLMRNEALKAVLLDETPWVRAALAETARMQSLEKYADPTAALSAIEGSLAKIAALQNADGGWSWCPDMKSSPYMTMRVLTVFGSLRNLGFLPDAAANMAGKAFGYMDRHLAAEWKNNRQKSYSRNLLLDYLYARSAFGHISASGGFGALESVVLKDLAAGWRDMSIARKATSAIVLERYGHSSVARIILESLRQFASVEPSKGMWFDNLQSGWNQFGPLLTTARVLEAYAEIRPDDPQIDAMRQWLTISKQTGDWGKSSGMAEVIGVLLNTGSDWIAVPEPPVVTLGGERIEIGSYAAMTGAFTVDLTGSDLSGKLLTVSRKSGSPAWGGILGTYVSPVTETPAHSLPQLSVNKSFNVVSLSPAGRKVETGTYRKGDRVRVTLTLVCDRDLEYVTVVDQRGACLEPTDKVSGYSSSDGVWYYKEIRNDRTTLFIPFLSKGTHVISYDCDIDRSGEYSVGIAVAQSQYAPLIVASSKGKTLTVTE